MRRIEKNRKGFTLAEEVVTVLLIGILVASASAILLNAMRIFCQNVIMFNAQSKGIAVMEQLEDRLNYAKEIGGSYGGISDISRKADCAHQVLLSVKDDDDGKKELVEDGYLYYSDAEDSKNEIHNVLCKLGNYDAEIDLKSGSGNTAVLTVRIKRNDTALRILLYQPAERPRIRFRRARRHLLHPLVDFHHFQHQHQPVSEEA